MFWKGRICEMHKVSVSWRTREEGGKIYVDQFFGEERTRTLGPKDTMEEAIQLINETKAALLKDMNAAIARGDFPKPDRIVNTKRYDS
jgi:hypothetical protein